MITTTSYGTWVNHGDRHNVTVDATVLDFLNGGDAEWRQRVEDTGAFAAMVADYREAINEALPGGVALAGNDFYGPYYDRDAQFDGYPLTDTGTLDIASIVGAVDLSEIVQRHDPDLA